MDYTTQKTKAYGTLAIFEEEEHIDRRDQEMLLSGRSRLVETLKLVSIRN